MTIPFRPLGLVKEVVEAIGDEVTYAYEDLVFISHNQYLLRFGAQGEEVYFHAHQEANESDTASSLARLADAAQSRGLAVMAKGRYRLDAQEDQQLALTFLDDR